MRVLTSCTVTATLSAAVQTMLTARPRQSCTAALWQNHFDRLPHWNMHCKHSFTDSWAKCAAFTLCCANIVFLQLYMFITVELPSILGHMPCLAE